GMAGPAGAEEPELACAATGQLLAAMDHLAGSLARASGVTLGLGPVLAPGPEGLERLASIFGPAGELLGRQAQTHRTAEERATCLAAGALLAPIETPVGRVGLVNGADILYPEVSRILCLQGADVLAHQGALQRYDEAVALSRLWREVQANQVFGVEAYAVGPGLRGRSAVHAPLEITPEQDGWLARAPADDRPAVVLADLDPSALDKLLRIYPIHALRNPGQYARYFPGLYRAAAQASRGRDGRA
ncbi:MAG: nitrilase-related carbon-nitrogen hydrolase, partial [Anaerolineae bacterium]|nr:nitrilase-related carbon-nitrogen hydrolase [Anaerolineae bacterium]